MKKLLSLALVLVLVFSLAACSGADAEAGDLGASSGGVNKSESHVGVGGAEADIEGGDGGIVGDGTVDGDIVGGDIVGGGTVDGAYKDELYFGEAAEIVGEPTGGGTADDSYNRPSAGLLTAGEWKDLENIDFWRELLNRNDWYSYMEARNLYTNNIKVVYVHDEDGNPCYNASVELLDANDSVLYRAKTDIEGNAYLFWGLNKGGESPVSVRVNSSEKASLSDGVTEVMINSGTNNVEALDLMFMIDTTGSMMDELRYLQSEVEDVVLRVAKASENILSIRVSVNFYRDNGDKYVVLPFDFTSDIAEAKAALAAQSADGGGDYPEAVHKALDNAILEHQWRGNAVKLMFLVLDAPPHREQEIQGINKQILSTVSEAASQGIRIIPVASSGVDTETEFLLRSYAALTGGTYLFLTNHSGIGGDHLEPTIGQYEVEQLNACLVRVISEYCGLEAPKKQ